MNENNMSPVQRLCYRYGVKPTESRFDVMLPKVMELAWIPCSERLPEVKMGWDSEVNTYLVTVDDGAIYTDIDIIRKSGFDKYQSNVIAWMPLPKPYKDGDADE